MLGKSITGSITILTLMGAIAGCATAPGGTTKTRWAGTYEIKEFKCEDAPGVPSDHCHVHLTYDWAISNPAPGSFIYTLDADVEDANGGKVRSQGLLWPLGQALVGPLKTLHNDGGKESTELHWVVLRHKFENSKNNIYIEMCDAPVANSWNTCDFLRHLGVGHGED